MLKNNKIKLLKKCLIVNLVFLFLFIVPKPINKIAVPELYSEKKFIVEEITSSSAVIKEKIYPEVKFKPKGIFFQIEKIFDKNKDDRLFQLNKKVAQLIKWNNDLDWQKQLNEYEILFIPYINSKTSVFELIKLRKILNTHFFDLQTALHNTIKSDAEKMEISRKLDSVFEKIEAKINLNLPAYNPYVIKYSLNEIDQQKEYGAYNASINLSSFIDNSMNLQIKENSYFPTINQINKKVVFNNILINKNSRFLTLNISKAATLLLDNWEEKYESDFSKFYYYLDIENLEPKEKYFLKFSTNLENNLLFVFSEEYKKGGQIVEKTLVNQVFYPNKNLNYSNTFETNKQKVGYFYRAVLVSKKPLPGRTLKKTRLEIIPIKKIALTKVKNLENTKPAVTLKRTGPNRFQMITTDTTFDQDKYIMENLSYGWRGENDFVYFEPATILFKLFIFSVLVSFLCFFYLIFGFISNLPLIRNFKINLLFLIHKIEATFALFKTPSSILIIFFIFYEIFFERSGSNILIFFTIFCWLLIIVIYHVESRIHFFFGILLLSICPLLLVFGYKQRAEKLAIWTIYLLILGIIQRFLELKNKNLKLINFKIFILGFVKDTKDYLINIAKKVQTLTKKRGFMIKINRNIIFINPKIILIFSFMLVIFISIHIKFKYFSVKNQYEKPTILSPVIIKIQPTLLYPGQRLIITGKNFCFETSKACSLEFSNMKEPIIAPMTENKIIITLPLTWKKNTIIYVRVIKKIHWLGKEVIKKSNVLSFKIIDPESPWNAETDQYFEQLKIVDPEVLRINGY